jgi:aquaporin Z
MFILGLVVLATTRKGVSTEFAGLAIGLTVTVLLLTFINVTGASPNPAPEFWTRGVRRRQGALPVLAIPAGPSIGGLLAGVIVRLLWTVEPTADELRKASDTKAVPTPAITHRDP